MERWPNPFGVIETRPLERAMENLKSLLQFAVLLASTLFMLTAAYGQITPSGDAYTNTAAPTTNLGTKPLLDVESASQITYIQFDLSSIPTGYTSASVAKATLKLLGPVGVSGRAPVAPAAVSSNAVQLPRAVSATAIPANRSGQAPESR